MNVQELSKPLRLIVRVKNNRLFNARKALGLSQKALGKASGVRCINQYENLAQSPINHTKLHANQWCDTALKLAAFLKMLPEDLWPETVRAIEKTHFEREISERDMVEIGDREIARLEAPPTPEAIAAEQELEDDVAAAIESLPPRLANIIRWRFGMGEPYALNLEEVGERLDLSRERVRQLEARAIQMLRSKVDMSAVLRDHNDERTP